MPITERELRDALNHELEHTDFSEFGEKVAGKVRDSYLTEDGRRILVTTDRISAFDRILGTLPLKGQVLNQLAGWWFEQSAELVPNHLLALPDPSVMIGMECTPLPVEFVMRSYLTGVTSTSIWTHYREGGRNFCGHSLPDGLHKNEALPKPILTPSTKAPKGGHDLSVSKEKLLEMEVISEADFAVAAQHAERLFLWGQRLCAARGLILADTKYEMGKTADGRIVLIDEIHTPDSSRYWRADTYEARLGAGEEPDSFDKEYVRRFLANKGWTGDGPMPPIPDEIRIEASRRYIEACETIRGESFTANLENPIQRIRTNLVKALGS